MCTKTQVEPRQLHRVTLWVTPTSPTCHFPLPTSYFLLPTSYFLHPTSYFLLPTSYFLLHRVPTLGDAVFIANARVTLGTTGENPIACLDGDFDSDGSFSALKRPCVDIYTETLSRCPLTI